MMSRGKVLMKMALKNRSKFKQAADGDPPLSETVVVNAEGHANPDLHSLAVDTDAQIVLKDADIPQVERSSSSASSSSESSSSSSSSSSDSSDDDTGSKEDGYLTDDSVRDKDYVPDCDYVRSDSDEMQSEEDDSNYLARMKKLYAGGVRKPFEPSRKTNIQEGRTQSHDEKTVEMQRENEENIEVEELTVTSSNAETNYREFDSPKKSRKRKLDPSKWKKNINKKRRNMGLSYESMGNKHKQARKMKPTCKETCRLKCTSKISHDQREHIFYSYWKMGNIDLQRQYIVNCTKEVKPTYRCIKEERKRPPRANNIWYSFPVDGSQTRVCKTFFLNTLDINDRVTRTALAKQNETGGKVVEEDKRGKHENHASVDPQIKEGVRAHIDSIPRIESHYARARTTRTYICGSRSLADIHRDYTEECRKKQKPYATYGMFHSIFSNEYNISFFTPKKDQCDECMLFNDAQGEDKEKLKEKYDKHQSEKKLSREEKNRDKSEGNSIVAVYDLQAVMQLPQGDQSTFYYKSKLNVLNFTIYNIKTNDCDCFLWDETNGNRGANEIGTCVLKYIRKLCEEKKGEENIKIIFYSDNCSGQQKNKFMLALYLFAVINLPVESITHKFLIRGHTQNEGDCAHSLIERQIKRLRKGGPIYIPETLVTGIRFAKKTGRPFHVEVMQYDDFRDVKTLTSQMGGINVKDLRLSEVKVMKFEKQNPNSVSLKYSYSDEFKPFLLIKKLKVVTDLLPCYSDNIPLSVSKKKDLKELCEKGFIPRYYYTFFDKVTC